MNKKRILFASLSHFICDVNGGALPAILPFLMSAHGFSYSLASGLMLANSSLSSIVQPLCGLMADRKNSVWYMPAGILITGLGMSALGFLDNYPALFVAVGISGLGSALFHPAAVRFANSVSGSSPGTGMSIFSVGGNAGYLLAPILAVVLVKFFGLRGITLLAPLAACLAAFMLYENFRLAKSSASQNALPLPGQRSNAASGPKPVNNWQAFGKLTVNIICRSIIMIGLRTFIPLYWISRFGQSKAAAALALTIFGAFGIWGNICGGMLADRLGYRQVVRISHLIVLPLMLGFPFINNFALATILLMILGFVLFMPFSALVMLGQRYLGGNAGFSAGVTMGLGMSIGGVAAPVLGKIADIWGLPLVFHCFSGIVILGTLFAFLLSPVPGAPGGRAEKKAGKGLEQGQP